MVADLWIATRNAGKLAEFKLLLKNLPTQLHSQKELPVFSSPPETGSTFLENARIKAKALKSVVPVDHWVLADDSGLCVEGLGGLPGVHSARYAGEKARDSENVAKLLKMMQIRNVARKAHFECVLVLISPEGQEHSFSGQLQGQIAHKVLGTNGFGYDPVFIPQGREQTLAQMTDAEKNAISHRAEATRMLLQFWTQN